MQISSSSSPFGRPLQANSLLANGHPKIQSIGRVAREGDDIFGHQLDVGSDAAPLIQPQDSAAFSPAAMAALLAETAAAQQATVAHDPLKAEQDKASEGSAVESEESEELTTDEQATKAVNAPAHPSSQGRAVTAQATQLATSARAEIAKANQEGSSGNSLGTSLAAATAPEEPGNPEPAATEQASAQVTQKAEQQDARKAQAMQMARRADAYREISQAITGTSARS